MNKTEGIEYYCSVFFSYNTKEKQQEYCIRVETVKVFSTLNYKLTVKAEKKKTSIDVKILGLAPDHTYMSTVKPAIADTFFKELYGEHTINIIKQEGTINSARFSFNIYKKEILLIGSADTERDVRQFCTFHTAEDLNTFP